MGIPSLFQACKARRNSDFADDIDHVARSHLDRIARMRRSSDTGAISDAEDSLHFHASFLFTVPPFVALCGLLMKLGERNDEALQMVSAYKKQLNPLDGVFWAYENCAKCRDGPEEASTTCSCHNRPVAMGNALISAGLVRLLGLTDRVLETVPGRDGPVPLDFDSTAPSAAVRSIN